MVLDPLGLAGKVRDIEQLPELPVQTKELSTAVCVRADKTVTSAEKMAAVNSVLRAARAEKRRRNWDFVE